LFAKGFFGFLHFEIQYKCFYTLRKRQISKYASRGIYVHSPWFFCDSSGSWRIFWHFYVGKQLFYSKKVLTHHIHVLASRCRSRCFGDAWDPSGIQTCLSVVSLNALLYSFFYKATHIRVLWSFLLAIVFFFIIFSLFQRMCICVLSF